MVFDPAVISYEELLDLFWKQHDPSWAVSSRQYRSAAFTQGADQLRLATASRAAIPGAVTAIEPLTSFTPAEDYHQKYYLRRSQGLVSALVRVTGDERAFMDSTAAARLNAYIGGDAGRDAVARELEALGLQRITVEAVMKRL